MKEYSWDTPPKVVLTGFLTKEHEEVGSSSKGEEIQSILEELPTSSADLVKSSSLT